MTLSRIDIEGVELVDDGDLGVEEEIAPTGEGEATGAEA
jgi:hypothetical protein